MGRKVSNQTKPKSQISANAISTKITLTSPVDLPSEKDGIMENWHLSHPRNARLPVF